MPVLEVKEPNLVFSEGEAAFVPETSRGIGAGDDCQEEEGLDCYDGFHMPLGGVEAWPMEVEGLSNLDSSALRSYLDAGLWLESTLQEYMADSWPLHYYSYHRRTAVEGTEMIVAVRIVADCMTVDYLALAVTHGVGSHQHLK